jgi:hypothetical protein
MMSKVKDIKSHLLWLNKNPVFFLVVLIAVNWWVFQDPALSWMRGVVLVVLSFLLSIVSRLLARRYPRRGK